jgi:hypothetical protein
LNLINAFSNFFKGVFSLNYQNARDVLPPELLDEIQKYTSGSLIYIPQKSDRHMPWGQLSGCREELRRRNRAILARYRAGVPVCDLMDEFCLSESSIKKILYKVVKTV